jgi:hypothetical protein
MTIKESNKVAYALGLSLRKKGVSYETCLEALEAVFGSGHGITFQPIVDKIGSRRDREIYASFKHGYLEGEGLWDEDWWMDEDEDEDGYWEVEEDNYDSFYVC